MLDLILICYLLCDFIALAIREKIVAVLTT